ERIGNEAEQPQRRLDADEVRRRQIFVELVDDVVAHLRARTAQHHRLALERESGGLGDDGHHAVHHVLELRLALHRLRALPAREADDENTSEHAGSRQPVHSMPFPTATPTTRATSLPPTTMPWRSSSSRS